MRSPPTSPSTIFAVSFWQDVRYLFAGTRQSPEESLSLSSTWKNPTHQLSRMERYFVYFGIHAICPRTLRYCKAVQLLGVFRLFTLGIYLTMEPLEIYTPVAWISWLWRLMCLLASTSLIFGLHRHLCEYFQELCSDPDPDMARHLRTHLNCTVQRLMAPAIFLVLANVAFLVMVVSGAFSFLVPSVEGYTRFMQRTFSTLSPTRAPGRRPCGSYQTSSHQLHGYWVLASATCPCPCPWSA